MESQGTSGLNEAEEKSTSLCFQFFRLSLKTVGAAAMITLFFWQARYILSSDWSFLLTLILIGQRGSGQVSEQVDLAAGEAGGLGQPPLPQHHLLPQIHF